MVGENQRSGRAEQCNGFDLTSPPYVSSIALETSPLKQRWNQFQFTTTMN